MTTYVFLGWNCFLLLFQLVNFVQLLEGESKSQPICPKEFSCGHLRNVSFPFSNNASRPECGLHSLDCDATPYPTIRFGQHEYEVKVIVGEIMVLFDPLLENYVLNRSCNIFHTTTLFSFPSSSASISFELTFAKQFYKCNRSSSGSNVSLHHYYFRGYESYNSCQNLTLYYTQGEGNNHTLPAECSVIHLPYNIFSNETDLFRKLNSSIVLEWKVSEICEMCHYNGGQCLTHTNNKFRCLSDAGKKQQSKGIVILVKCGLALILFGPLTICVIVIVLWCRKKKGHGASSSQLSTNWDLEGCKLLGVHVFSYSELEKATDFFHSDKELGDGGFGTVYHGKLRDGREVAVKRLYQHNYKRVEQFINEIKILTSLRHCNLVTLYGCTSRHSRELLLVYEYIPNGTIADHLHGEKAKDGLLTWPIRMKIAVETATALAYLHASDIIHRDVKTTNILLDNNFCVKVADFGLSRFLPNDVTHVSTAPQGTPGYVDPEYHECYQLTDKSDVYSFGVVLVELISSMPAVDTSRHRDEINLANLAMNKILRCSFNELIDPSLGFETDGEIMRMATSVAELAFQCLQPKKHMRPTMDDVVETLKGIQGGEFQDEAKNDQIDKKNLSSNVEVHLSPESEHVVLLKKISRSPTSPTSVADRWFSSSTAASNSV